MPLHQEPSNLGNWLNWLEILGGHISGQKTQLLIFCSRSETINTRIRKLLKQRMFLNCRHCLRVVNLIDSQAFRVLKKLNLQAT
jgi:hypothetical protein